MSGPACHAPHEITTNRGSNDDTATDCADDDYAHGRSAAAGAGAQDDEKHMAARTNTFYLVTPHCPLSPYAACPSQTSPHPCHALEMPLPWYPPLATAGLYTGIFTWRQPSSTEPETGLPPPLPQSPEAGGMEAPVAQHAGEEQRIISNQERCETIETLYPGIGWLGNAASFGPEDIVLGTKIGQGGLSVVRRITFTDASRQRALEGYFPGGIVLKTVRSVREAERDEVLFRRTRGPFLRGTI